MNYLFFILTILITCLLFDIMPFKERIANLLKNYPETLQLLQNGDALALIIKHTLSQFKLIAVLLLMTSVILSPFLLLDVYLKIKHINLFHLFLNTTGNVLSLVTSLVYFLIKRYALKSVFIS